jgi:hypothetical protein
VQQECSEEERSMSAATAGACMPVRTTTRLHHTQHRNNGRRMYAGEGNHTPAPHTTHRNNGRRMYAGEGNHTPAPHRTHTSTVASTRADHTTTSTGRS